jgi:RimJ/RimL family protein N-acetyltransferase
MAESKVKTGGPELKLVPATSEFLRDLLENPNLDKGVREAAEGTVLHQARTGAPAPGPVILPGKLSAGSGFAFVDRPRDGEVEIAYGVFSPNEGRGIATEMAPRLIARAFCENEVSAVTANTAPEHGASTRILQKLGFVRDGVIQDADIGEAWRWRKPR